MNRDSTIPPKIRSMILHPWLSLSTTQPSSVPGSGQLANGITTRPRMAEITAPSEKNTESPVRRYCDRFGVFSRKIVPSGFWDRCEMQDGCAMGKRDKPVGMDPPTAVPINKIHSFNSPNPLLKPNRQFHRISKKRGKGGSPSITAQEPKQSSQRQGRVERNRPTPQISG